MQLSMCELNSINKKKELEIDQISSKHSNLDNEDTGAVENALQCMFI